MKNYLIVMLMVFSFSGFSINNNSDSISINKKKLSEIKYLHELMKNFPKDCKSISAEVVGKVGGVVITGQCKSDELSEAIRNILVKADSKSNIYVDTKTECPKAEARTLKIILTD